VVMCKDHQSVSIETVCILIHEKIRTLGVLS